VLNSHHLNIFLCLVFKSSGSIEWGFTIYETDQLQFISFIQLPQDPMDIAASIKALAKSVHGDANVFGDLPRPRFSTQI
jgi:hypothetical protein